MPEPSANAVKSALEAYLAVPSTDHYRRLVEHAESYRDDWIESHAGPPSKRAAPRDGATSYVRKHEVTQLVYGVPVTLALQRRTGPGEPQPWWVLSWRTKYSERGSNRRFYLTREGCWTIPAQVALGMIQMMDSEGGLAEQYHDHRYIGAYAQRLSTDMTSAERDAALAGCTAADEYWGRQPFLAVTAHPDSQWQKVLLINSDDNLATFRSITRDPHYMPKKTLREDADWWLDNSMMDVSVQEMRMLYAALASYCETLDDGGSFAPE